MVEMRKGKSLSAISEKHRKRIKRMYEWVNPKNANQANKHCPPAHNFGLIEINFFNRMFALREFVERKSNCKSFIERKFIESIKIKYNL